MGIKEDDPLESLMSHLGEFGRYQCFQFFLCFLSAITAGLHMMTTLSTAGVPEHRCLVPWLEVNTTLPWDSEELMSAIPKEEDGSLSSCLIFHPATNTSTTCNAWVYNTTYYTYNRVTQWNMVCDRRWMLALSQSTYLFGVFTGAITCGALADKYGRKTIFCWSAFFQLIISVGIAFVNYYPLFLATQVLNGIAGSAGAYGTAFVLVMELVGASKRSTCGLLFNIGFPIGIMLVAAWGSLISNATILQLILGAHSLLIFFHWRLIDESPRWLWTQGRITESVNIVAKGVLMNRGTAFDRAEYISKGKAKAAAEEPHSAGLLDLFKNPRLRARTINISFCWFANSLAYYGLSLNSNKMEGNPSMNIFIMALVEIPAYITAILLLDRIGRRFVINMLMLAGGAFCMCTAIIPLDMVTATTIIVFLGKSCISGSFVITNNYSAEVFPTVVRNTGIGFGVMCGRFAAMLAPAITLLDGLDTRLPLLVFAMFTLVSGFFTLYLPETMDQPLPETIEDGETFRIGDTAFANGCFPRTKKKDYIQANPI